MMGLRTNAGNMAKGKQPVRWDQESSEDEQEPGKVGFSHSEGDSDEDPVTSGSASLHESSESEAEPQASTYAQFQGESDLEDEEDLDDSDIRDSQESSEAEASEADTEQDDDEATERALRQKMASIPFGELVKARKAMQKRGNDDEDDDDYDAYSEEDEWAADRARLAKNPAASSKTTHGGTKKIQSVRSSKTPDSEDRKDDREKKEARARREIQSRTNKHAPQEVSSRRPVSRKRSVVQGAESSSSDAQRRRDPRFSSLSGPAVNAGMFSKSYAFVSDAQSQELSTLRQTLSKLRKLEANNAGPRAKSQAALDIQAERERVERTLKREEAKEAERKKRAREQEVLRNFKRENEERVKRGGKQFYLKDSAKRQLFLQDKFSRLAGKRAGDTNPVKDGPVEASSSKALRKALDKRRKKNAAKERKSMPFLEAGRRGGEGNGPPTGVPARKRSNDAVGHDQSRPSGAPQKRKRGSRGASKK